MKVDPKIGDKILDRYGHLEITAVNTANRVCIVQRHATGKMRRNPFIVSFSEWQRRKAGEATP